MELRERLDESARHFTQIQSADLMGVSRARLSKWKREHFLLPSLGGERDMRGQGQPMSGYTLNDVCAGRFARATIDHLGFDHESVGVMVRLIQEDDWPRMKRAAIATVKTTPGLMRHIFIEDTARPPVDAAKLLGVDRDFADGDELLRYLDSEKRLIDSTTLFDAALAIHEQILEELENAAAASATEEAC